MHCREHLVPELRRKDESWALDPFVPQLAEEKRRVPQALQGLVAQGHPDAIGAAIGGLLVGNVFRDI